MSADTGAVDAAVIDVEQALINEFLERYPHFPFGDAAAAAIAAFQRSQAARVTALVDEFENACVWFGNDLNEKEEKDAIENVNRLRAALLKAVVGAQAEQGAGE